jgi:hypothetical protein
MTYGMDIAEASTIRPRQGARSMNSQEESGPRHGSWQGMVELMQHLKIPVTRENFLELEYFGKVPKELSPEQEEELPPSLRKAREQK